MREPRINRHLVNWPPEVKVEASEHLVALTQQPGWKILIGLLHDEREKSLQMLVVDSPRGKEAAEYAKELGRIEGLALAEAAIETVLTAAEEADRQLKAAVAA